MTKARKFRQLLHSKNLEFICEVHNALSARIVEEAGFKAMWGKCKNEWDYAELNILLRGRTK